MCVFECLCVCFYVEEEVGEEEEGCGHTIVRGVTLQRVFESIRFIRANSQHITQPLPRQSG